MEYGLHLILIIALTGGLVAFLGDKIGTKVGKKRIRIFGMRPKKTSILITVITGFLIAASTIGVATLLSQNVRTALFGMDKLKYEMKYLSNEITVKNDELLKEKAVLEKKTKELTALNDEVEDVKKALEIQAYQKYMMEEKLQTAEKDYKTTLEKLKKSQDEVSELEDTKNELDGYIRILEKTKQELQADLEEMREGDVVFRNGEVLAGAIVKTSNDPVNDELLIKKFMDDLNVMVLKRMNIKEDKKFVYITPENIKVIVGVLQNSNEKMLIRALAAGNVVYGQPATVSLDVQPYRLIYEKNAIVLKKTLKINHDEDKKIMQFLKEVNKLAQEHGVIKNPITGEVGSISGSELYRTIDELSNINGEVSIEAYTSEDVYTTGPLKIHLRVVDRTKRK